jgi:Melibiase/Alpha galactosidase C-terminal beta sandwich domain
VNIISVLVLVFGVAAFNPVRALGAKAASAGAIAGHAFSVSHEGWTLTADETTSLLAVGHARLGTLLTNVHLQVHAPQGVVPARGWSFVNEAPDRLVIRTAEPVGVWRFDMSLSALQISCTAPEAALTALAPVSPDRTTARLLDPQGVPVEWQGTGEVAVGYGGSRTRNSSFLPRRNPDCMYFALGNVSGAVFHSLFDRVSDMAIEFPEETQWIAPTGNQDVLELTLPLSGITQIRLTPEYYTKALGVPFYAPFDERRFPRPPMVWCSWTSYYGDVTEQEVVENTDWLAKHLKPYGFQYVQLDDGYDRGLKKGHYWIENWDPKKFPHGPKWLTEYIKSKGLHPGLWLVPNAYAGAVKEHPDWYLRDEQGGIIQDYGTPALDSTHPEVLDFLKKLFTTLRAWGFEYFKFDGEHALPKYVPAVDRAKLHDPAADPIVSYRRRLDAIRETIGPDTFVEGCPAGTPLNGIGFFNSYFNGHDMYNNWQGMYALFGSISANAFLNRMVVYVMPGEGMELGDRMTVEEATRKRPAEVITTAREREKPMIGFGLAKAEARTLVSMVALSGVAYPLAGVMPELPADRLTLLEGTLPTMPIRPADLFSRGADIDWDTFTRINADDYIHHYPEVIDLKVNAPAGRYDVVALPNWRSRPVVKNISVTEKLGLLPGASYVVFDFWNQKLVGVLKDRLSVAVEGHDTRVLMIHPLLDHPQLIGTSRHITGAYSIGRLAWDASQKALVGSSETVPGRPYSLFIHVPENAVVARVSASTQAGEMAVRRERVGNLLSLTFEGKPEAVRWRVLFSDTAKR